MLPFIEKNYTLSLNYIKFAQRVKTEINKRIR